MPNDLPLSELVSVSEENAFCFNETEIPTIGHYDAQKKL